jgi:hypothetical protein
MAFAYPLRVAAAAERLDYLRTLQRLGRKVLAEDLSTLTPGGLRR